MRLLVQRVLRAAAEVDSCVESRIGPGVLLTLAVTAGDSELVAQNLATKVLSLNLWPEVIDPDVPWKTNLVDNGYEVLVLLQPSLCATFPRSVPVEERALPLAEARPIVEAFVAKLRSGYQEEMIVLAPLDGPALRLEVVSESAGTFVLGAGDASAARGAAAGGKGKVAESKPVPPLRPELNVVTKALQNLRYLPKRSQNFVQESSRAYKALGNEALQAALAEAAQAESDAFVGALDAAGGAFSHKQREQITQWTGLPFSDELNDEAGLEEEDVREHANDQEAPDDEVEKQLAELRGEVTDRKKGIEAAKRRRDGKAANPKEEPAEDTVRRRPDWTGRAAPETPAIMAARQWAANRQQRGATAPAYPWAGGKGKGGKGGRNPRRSLGIASLDVASALHGQDSGSYAYGQSTQHSDRQLHLTRAAAGQAGEEGPGAKRRAMGAGSVLDRLPRGTPTVAPMCPAGGGGGDGADDDDDI